MKLKYFLVACRCPLEGIAKSIAIEINSRSCSFLISLSTFPFRPLREITSAKNGEVNLGISLDCQPAPDTSRTDFLINLFRQHNDAERNIERDKLFLRHYCNHLRKFSLVCLTPTFYDAHR